MKPTALITGCSGGIGLACVEKFQRHNFVVCGVDIGFSKECIQSITKSGGITIESNVVSLERANEAVENIYSKFRQLNVVVTCAGISKDAKIDNLTDEDWCKVLGTDLKGTFNYIQAAAKVMKQQGFGKIVTISSTLGLRARKGVANYCAAKSGVIGLTKAAARDLGKYNINVNSVAPGLVKTALAEKIPQDVQKRLLEETCLNRFTLPEDIANIVYFLSSEDSRNITGEVIRVDAGALA